jgi:putative endonuclease
MWYVYLLQSEKTEQYYIGQTDNLKGRFKEHNNGEVSSTRKVRPWKLIGFEIHDSRSSARFREYQLKHHSGRKQQFIQTFVSKREGKNHPKKPARRG